MEFIIFCTLIALFIYIGRANGWFRSGNRTEWIVANRYLSKLTDEYVVFNDVLFKDREGRTHQIDHVVVSPYGIFVIETKGYSGKVYGGQYSKQWTEYLRGEGYPFQNPIRQNFGHIRSLIELMKLPEAAFVSIVAFSSSATLKIAIKNKKAGEVIEIPDLISTIRSYDGNIMTRRGQRRIIDLIKKGNIQSPENRKRHIAQVKKRISEASELN